MALAPPYTPTLGCRRWAITNMGNDGGTGYFGAFTFSGWGARW
ncbi:MAG: hypothetical protein ACJ8F3_11145 [Xanthobacteraceae bacterium]